MLELKHIKKSYKTGDFEQNALDDVSISFRKSEFVSILGPSGSGKTTLLNIVGGLDRADSGDLIIDGKSTKKYKSKDYDTYRNHMVGFVFQSYNLIGHQSVYKNVELSLTISGIKRKARKRRVIEILKKVGLQDHIHKKPSELSGGQMQRVAIARALVNNPKIILADEPTGALDSKTSTQIMELLKEISKDKLLIMVTHNEELANEYSSRIVKLKDGKVVDDTNPYEEVVDEKEYRKTKKARMKLSTALTLSFNNLLTKKGRTMLMAFAGSIGIIGIALIISISSSLRNYISEVQVGNSENYPIEISENAFDFNALYSIDETTNKTKCEENQICNYDDISQNGDFKLSFNKYNLAGFKKALDSNYKNIQDKMNYYEYFYSPAMNVYDSNTDKINAITKYDLVNANSNPYGFMTSYYSGDLFKELPSNEKLINENLEVLYGQIPSNKNEIAVVVDNNGQLSTTTLYSLNLVDRKEIETSINEVKKDKDKSVNTYNVPYLSFLNKSYKLVLPSSLYVKENNIYVSKIYDEAFLKNKINEGLELKIVGILKNKENSSNYSEGIVYTSDLAEYVLEENNKSQIIIDQINNPSVNVFTNKEFDTGESYDNNIETLGYRDINSPSSINLYPKSLSDRESIISIIDEYNEEASKDDKVLVSDMLAIAFEALDKALNGILYVLIAFVSISLIVSSIMIAIITYISVLERTKEIGILRSIGASKKDIKRVFISETIIEGLLSGLLGVLISTSLLGPIEHIIKSIADLELKVKLPNKYALMLILISVVITVFSGLIPSRIASKKDPVESLRSE